MRYFPTFLLFLALLQGCGNPAAEAATEPATEPTTTETTTEAPLNDEATNDEDFQNVTVRYRSDGFYPGIASEWLEVTYSYEPPKVISVLYWNSNDETKIPLDLQKQEFEEEGITGYSGELAFPGQDPIGFGSIEDRFNFVHPGDRFQEFELEQE